MITQLRKYFLLWGIVLPLCFATVDASVVANPENEEPIDEELLKLMLTGKEKFWDSGSEVVIAILRSESDADDALSRYSGMTMNKFKNHWQRIAFSGRGKMPKMFSSIDELEAFVKNNKGAIGIVSTGAQPKSLRRVDLGMIAVRDETTLLAMVSP